MGVNGTCTIAFDSSPQPACTMFSVSAAAVRVVDDRLSAASKSTSISSHASSAR